MKNEDAMSLVNDIERAIPVSAWRLYGVQLWPIVRSRLIWAAFDTALGEEYERDETAWRIVRRAGTALRSVGSAVRNLSTHRELERPAGVVIVTDGVATTRIGDSAYDVVADPLRELIATSGTTVHTWYTTYACPTRRHTEGVLLQWRLDAAQLGGLMVRRSSAQHAVLSRYEEFLSMVRGAGLPERAVAFGRVSQLAARVAVMADCFGRWLRTASPHLVFVNCYYSLEGAALMLACRRQGVLSIDIQHGVQGEQHFAYGKWVNVPPLGYELLPRRFWCWTELEVRAIQSWAGSRTDGHVALLGGNPWMEMWRDERAPLVGAADKAVQAIVRPGRCTALVSLQWRITDRSFLTPVLDLIAGTDDAWTWWLRLHPVMRNRRREIKAMLRARGLTDVFLDEPSDLALPALLKHSDVHLTYSSSTVLEAAALGVASVVASASGETYFSDLVREGMVLQLDSLEPQATMVALQTMSRRRRRIGDAKPELGRTVIRELLAEAQSGRSICVSSSA